MLRGYLIAFVFKRLRLVSLGFLFFFSSYAEAKDPESAEILEISKSEELEAPLVQPGHHPWSRFLYGEVERVSDRGLRLESETLVLRFLKYFGRAVERESQNHAKYPTREDFFKAVRQKKIGLSLGEGAITDLMNGLPEGFERWKDTDPESPRIEAVFLTKKIQVEEEGRRVTKKIPVIGAKYAPARKLTSKTYGGKRNRVRILFPIIPGLSLNRDVGQIDLMEEHVWTYAHKILFNTPRHVLILGLEGNIETELSVSEGVYLRRPSFWSEDKREYLDKWFKATIQHPDGFKDFRNSLLDATGQGAVAFAVLGSHKISAVVFTSAFILNLYTHTQDAIIRRGSTLLTKILRRMLIGAPSAIATQGFKYGWGSLLYMKTLVGLGTIQFIDKFGSEAFMFVIRAKDKYRMTEGDYLSNLPGGGVDKIWFQRQTVVWLRKALELLAIKHDQNPDAEFHSLGKALQISATVPAYIHAIWFTKKHSEQFPEMKQDLRSLLDRVNPMTYVRMAGRFALAAKDFGTKAITSAGRESIKRRCQHTLAHLAGRHSYIK